MSNIMFWILWIFFVFCSTTNFVFFCFLLFFSFYLWSVTIRIVYKEFLSAYVKVPTVPMLTTVNEGMVSSSRAGSPVVPRLAIAGVVFPPLNEDEEVLALLND